LPEAIIALPTACGTATLYASTDAVEELVIRVRWPGPVPRRHPRLFGSVAYIQLVISLKRPSAIAVNLLLQIASGSSRARTGLASVGSGVGTGI
jgi:hypothetical protein